MPYQIRLLCLEDLYQPSFFETLSNLRPVGDLAPAQAEEIFKACQAQGIETYVACEGDNIIGTIRLLFESKFYHPGKLAAHIEDVATHAQHQGRGVGRALLEHALAVCREKACYKVILDCDDKLIPFYQKFGFKEAGAYLRFDF
jgi:glucosamine-phosphate N-acetyltransferase